ncbi:hypothetical protein [Amycolatopsis sp. NPDC059657]|uniref:hypothetical protein n=1 Tax=Amycolatopsis sp. NPDC059657 TaxID=3346899 RepID=UPI003671BF86
MPGYRYDVFLSCARTGPSREWTVNHFRDLLDLGLAKLIEEPKIVLSGEGALRDARLLVPIWSPPYFTSPDCLSEWESMRLRERLCDRPLICPVRYSGEGLPGHDLRHWNRPHPSFRQTPRYDSLAGEVDKLAIAVAELLPRVPRWRAWPSAHPRPPAQPPPSLPQL